MLLAKTSAAPCAGSAFAGACDDRAFPKAIAERTAELAEQTHEPGAACAGLYGPGREVGAASLRCELLMRKPCGFAPVGRIDPASVRASDDRVDLLELESLFDADDLRDTVRFSLDLLPSVPEAQHVSGAQSYPTGVMRDRFTAAGSMHCC